MKITLDNCKPVLFVTLAALMLGACSKPEAKHGSQVAAKVDGSEISVLQVNQVISSAPNVTPDNVDEMRKQALGKLVDQQVILNKAYEEGLDRSPEVMTALEAAKREVIARAYLSRLVNAKIRPGDRELRQYFDAHPELFSERRIYSLQDIGIKKDSIQLSALKDTVSSSAGIQDVANALKSSNVKFSASSYTRPAEQIAIESLQQIKDLREGDMAVAETDDGYHVLRVVNAASAPVDFEKAQPMIKNYLVNTEGQKLVLAEIERLRSASNIQYVGAFAEGANRPAAPQVIPVKAVESKSDPIQKGVAGLN